TPSAYLFLSHIPPPPTSTLFPYTTLFRSFGASRTIRSACSGGKRRSFPPWMTRSGHVTSLRRPRRVSAFDRSKASASSRDCGLRSEEHTSELQSPCNLVCRLLLEKKKIQN